MEHTYITLAVLMTCFLGCVVADPCAPSCTGGSISLFPHPQECSKFYQCASGTAYLQTCPAGLLFSPTAKVCAYPDQAGCHSDPSRECGVEAPLTCTPKCPWHNAYMPHPRDCTKFYICGDFNAYESNCQAGLHYSKELVRCDYPEVANCIASPEFSCDQLLM